MWRSRAASSTWRRPRTEPRGCRGPPRSTGTSSTPSMTTRRILVRLDDRCGGEIPTRSFFPRMPSHCLSGRPWTPQAFFRLAKYYGCKPIDAQCVLGAGEGKGKGEKKNPSERERASCLPLGVNVAQGTTLRSGGDCSSCRRSLGAGSLGTHSSISSLSRSECS